MLDIMFNSNKLNGKGGATCIKHVQNKALILWKLFRKYTYDFKMGLYLCDAGNTNKNSSYTFPF